MQYLVGLVLIIMWMAGIVVAPDGWMTFFSFFPPVGWYHAVEFALEMFGLI